MKVMVDLCIVPLGVGVSLSRYIAECECILDKAGLVHQLHANGTNVEGEWDEVFLAIKHCHEKLHEMGVPRVSTHLHMGTRIDREQTMADKVQSVLSKLDESCDDEPQAFEVHGLS